MRLRPDGSIQPSSVPTWQNVTIKEDHAIYRCMVTALKYSDDPRNITANAPNPRVLYDVVVLGGLAAGQIITDCRLSSEFGGINSYWERTLQASSKEVTGAKLADCDGDVVFVQFVQGHVGYPVIVALDNGIKTSGSIGAKLADGPLSKKQFNGVYEEVNKDGEWVFKVKGGKATVEKGSFTPNKDPLVSLKIDKDEKYTREYKGKLKIEEDGKNDKVTTTFNGGLKVEEDGKNDKVVITTKGGLVLTLDGSGKKAEIVTGAGAKFAIDGQSGTVSAEDNAGGKLKINGSKVGLGNATNELVDLVQQLAQALSTDTFAGFGAPATNVMTYAQLAVKLSLIKGGV